MNATAKQWKYWLRTGRRRCLSSYSYHAQFKPHSLPEQNFPSTTAAATKPRQLSVAPTSYSNNSRTEQYSFFVLSSVVLLLVSLPRVSRRA